MNAAVRYILLCLFTFIGYSASAQDSVSVYFPTGSSTLSREAIVRLDSLFYLEKIQGVTALSIYGYADEPGGRQINRRLSTARAAAVREHLLRSGIRPERIVECTGKGHYSGRGDDPSERRADLLLGRRLQSPPQPRVSPRPPRPDTAKAAEMRKILAGLRENEAAALDDIIFYGGSSSVRPESTPTMELLAQFLEQNPAVHIRLEGHICCMGLGGNDDALSTRRAQTVYNYLVDKGIDTTRLSYRGFGHWKPKKFPELTEEDMQQNRRVEVRILKK